MTSSIRSSRRPGRNALRRVLTTVVAGTLATAGVVFTAGPAAANSLVPPTWGAIPSSPANGNSTTDVATAVTADGQSGSLLSFASNTPTICSVPQFGSVAGNAASVNPTYLKAGNCGLKVQELANNGFTNSANTNSPQWSVVAVTPVITFSIPAAGNVGDQITLSATSAAPPSAPGATPTGAITFAVPFAYSSDCAVSGSTLTLKQIGPCVVDVNQAAAWPYAAVKNQPSNQMTIGGEAQTITFSSPADGSSAQGGSNATLLATATSGLPVAFSIDGNSGSGVCSISGTTVNYLTSGTCVIDANQAGDSTTWAAAPQVQNTVTVTGSPQNITFTSPADNSSATATTNAALVATAPGGTVAFTIDGNSTAGACAIDGSNPDQVDYLAAGTCIIDANQSGGNGYLAATQVQHSVTVTKASQAISFTSPTDGSSDTALNNAALTATAPGGTVTFTASPSTVCKIDVVNAAQVDYLASGTCTITANQGGNATYLAASPVSHAITVGHASQVITFTSPTDGSSATATTNAVLSATAPGGVVTFSIDGNSTAGACAIDGGNPNQVDYLTSGTCVIDANQSGDATYAAASQVSHTIAIGVASQAITFTAPTSGSTVTAGTHAALTATASSGLTVSFSIDGSSTAGACAIDGANPAQVDYLAAGTCVIDANQSGTVIYGPATQVQHSVTVKLSQAITFTSPADGTSDTATHHAALTATASSGLPVSFSIDGSSTAGACAIDASNSAQVDYLAAGTCVVDVNQAGNGTYLPAAQLQHAITVNKAPQTITFTSPADGSSATATHTAALTATASSGLPVTFSIDGSSTAGACKIDGSNAGQVDYLAAGTCVIDANQTGNGTYLAATQVQHSVTVNKAPQTITFTSPADGSVVASITAGTLAATASSGLPVVFSVDQSSTAGACSVNDATGVVSYLSHGTCVIDADQAGNGTYLAATQVQHTVTVKDPQTITFSAPADGSSDVATNDAALTATSSSGLPVTFSIDGSSTSGACAIDTSNANQVDYLAAGTCVIDANQAGNGTYVTAAQVQHSVTVNKAPQTITFIAPTDGSSAIATHHAALSATTTSNLVVSFSIDGSSTPGACAIDGSNPDQVDYLAGGTCVIDANQAGDGTYLAATQVQHSVTVNKAPQTITFSPTLTGTATQHQMLAGTASSGLPVTYTIDGSSTAGACAIDGSNASQVDYLTSGTCVVNANQAGNGTYDAAPQVQRTILIAKAAQTITFTMPSSGLVGQNVTLSATSSSGLPVTFTVDATSTAGACSITGGTQLNYLKLGTCKVDANQAGNVTFAAATQVQRAATIKSAQTITFTSPAGASSATALTHAALAATASSGLAVTFSIDASSTAGACKIDASNVKQVDYLAAGTCVIDANQAGNVAYAAAPQVQHSVTVNKAPQTITFASPANATAAVATHNAALTATASSGLAVTFSIDASSTAGACKIDASNAKQVDYLAAGTCVIDADQAGNGTYLAAAQVQHSVTITKAPQTITFTAPASGGVGQSVVLSPTASSGLPVTLSIDHATLPGTCQIDPNNANQVDYIANGPCIVDANQAGNSTYSPAAQVQQTIQVLAAQTITWTGPSIGVATQSAPLIATSSAGGPLTFPLTYSVDPASGSGVCSVSGSTVTYLTSGICVVDANQVGDSQYGAAPTAPQTITVSKESQTITFTLPSTSNAAQLATLNGSSTSGLPITYTTLTPAVCTVRGTKVTYLLVGTCTLTADQVGNATYAAAQQVQASTSVVLATDALTFPKLTAAYAGSSASLKATDLSGLPIAYSSTTPTVCSVTNATVHYLEAGTCSVRAAVADDGVLWIGNPSLTRSVSIYALPVITTGQLFHGTVGKKLTIQLTYRGGIPNVKAIWKVVSGHPPAGFRVVGDPTYTGTPRTAGTFRFVMSLDGVVHQTMTIVISKASSASGSSGTSSGGIKVPSLPDTGGPDLWLLWLAGGLFALGGLMLSGRRRRA